MSKLKCWKKTSDKFGPSYKNKAGDVLDLLITYKDEPVSVWLTKKDESKVRGGIQYGTEKLFKGTKTKALAVAQKYMKDHDSC